VFSTLLARRETQPKESVAEWLRSLTSNRCRLESRQGLWILSCEETIQLAYGTSVVLLMCPFVPEIMHGRAHEVFLHQWSLNVAIWPIMCRCDVKPKQTNKPKERDIYIYMFSLFAASKYMYLNYYFTNSLLFVTKRYQEPGLSRLMLPE
jgi:hypothetical protein